MMEGREGWLWTVADERRRYDANALSARVRTMARLPRRNIFSSIVSTSPSQREQRGEPPGGNYFWVRSGTGETEA